MRRGVTLLEIAVVIAIIGILGALSVASLQSIRSRAVFGGAAGDLMGALRQTRSEALGRGQATAFIIDTVGGQYWGIQTTSAFDVTTFSPATSIYITDGSLPRGVTFGPSTGYGAALPAPMTGIPISTKCSYCVTSPAGYGAIVFDPGGRATFSVGTGGIQAAGSGIGQQFTLTSTRDNVLRLMAVTIIGQTGAIESFER